MYKQTNWMTGLFLTLVLSACQEQPATPMDVSQAFWEAVKQKDVNAIRQLSITNSIPADLKSEDVVSITNASFGKIVIDGTHAEVETRVTVASDHPASLPLDTVLIQENEQWKVDYQASMSAIYDGSQVSEIIRELKVFGENFSKEFDQSMHELDKAMPEIEKEVNRMGEALKEHLPAIKKQFEDLARELQRSLEEALPPETEDDQKKSI